MAVTAREIEAYLEYLYREERSAATREKYRRSLLDFAAYLAGRAPDKAAVIEWKERLTGAVSTRNAAISAVNGLLKYLGSPECCVRQFRCQRRVFCGEGERLSRGEFERLVRAAEDRGQQRLARAMETIAGTGIRVSELRHFTVERVREGMVTVTNKGKSRSVLLPAALRKKLLAYCRARGIRCGEIFVTQSGCSLSREQLWAEMKRLCTAAGVPRGKVYPHNLRHLFATVHYRLHRDIVKLADLLGHSSVNTTRIYLLDSGREHLRQLEAMRLVI